MYLQFYYQESVRNQLLISAYQHWLMHLTRLACSPEIHTFTRSRRNVLLSAFDGGFLY